MHTVLDYLKKYGDTSLLDMPFTAVDSVAMCQLSYLKFDGIVPGVLENKPSISLEAIQRHPDYLHLFSDVRYEQPNRALVEAMLSGKRFRNMKLNCYTNIVEKEQETQFSAVTFILEDGTVYIAFRGTDENIIGWKEDFNMAFLAPVPGQEYSVKYLNSVASRIHRPLIIGGHSKGGNLAVYSSMYCKPDIQERIRKIYSLDGPGFKQQIEEQGNYNMIADRVVKFVPRASVVGMLLESHDTYRVVESKNLGITQHDMFSWLVEDNHLKLAKDILNSSRQMDRTVNTWVEKQDDAKLKVTVDALFDVIGASQVDNLIDLAADWMKNSNKILNACKNLDAETATIVRSVVKALFEEAGEQMRAEMTKNAMNVLDSTKELFSFGKAMFSSNPGEDKTE